jgi:hypothetical protein
VFLGLVEWARRPVGVPGRQPDGGLDLRLISEFTPDPRRRPVEQLAHRDVPAPPRLAGGPRLVADVRLPQQVALQECVDRVNVLTGRVFTRVSQDPSAGMTGRPRVGQGDDLFTLFAADLFA